MGTDCRIWLPDNVSVGNVAKVVARLAGAPAVKIPFSFGGGWSAEVPVEVKTTAVPEMVYILFKREGEPRNVGYHFECEDGGRLLMPRSTSFWIALGRRLVDFFGGYVDYNDCDGCDRDYSVQDKGRLANSPSDGEPWYDLQQRILALEPLTDAEIDACEQFAAYPTRR